MRKILTLSFVALLCAIVMPSSVYAVSTLPEGTNVTVRCADGVMTVGTAKHNEKSIKVPKDFICEDNSNVNLELTIDSDTFFGSGVYKKKENKIKNFIFAETYPTEVPEFGIITGSIALLTSGGSLFVFRRIKKS